MVYIPMTSYVNYTHDHALWIENLETQVTHIYEGSLNQNGGAQTRARVIREE